MKKRVVAFGVFDLIHPGHAAFLKRARALGDELVVVVARDARVTREKGNAPLFRERERLALVAAMRWVDKAVLGEAAGRWTLLARLKPAVVALGYDQTVATPAIVRQIAKLKNRPRIVPLPRVGPRHHASSQFKARLYDRPQTHP
ncbi:FAD synthase [Patescibacteria group bacterium]|nr:MAG: FAD synthase [Patescibacteria group bacterium]